MEFYRDFQVIYDYENKCYNLFNGRLLCGSYLLYSDALSAVDMFYRFKESDI